MVDENNRRLFVPLCIIISDSGETIEKKLCLKDLKTDEELINYINLTSKLGMINQPGLIT